MKKQTNNLYCLVSYLAYECTSKVLYCEDCPIKNCEKKANGEICEAREKEVEE